MREQLVMELSLLFLSSFAAATLLPIGSEVALFALLQQGFAPWLLVSVATVGNTAGSAVNWLLGRYLQRLEKKRWFYFSPAQVAKAERYFQRFGTYSLFFAWLPVVGDLLTLAAGIFNVRFLPFLLLVGCGKLMRYLLVVYLASPG